MSSLSDWTPLPESWRRRAWESPGSVLLESTLPSEDQHRSLLFTSPARVLTAHAPEDLPNLFAQIDQALAQGFYLAGYVTYEAGAHMQGVPAHALPAGNALACLGVFHPPEVFDHLAKQDHANEADAPEPVLPAPALQMAMLPALTLPEYEQRIAQVLEWICRGDTYQVNFTMPFQSGLLQDGLEAYTSLARQQPCSYSAMLRLDSERSILSFSPELFFSTDKERRITTRPMKGTAPRGASELLDQAVADALRRDEKNRAEHVMIVDLMRNDLGRICETGSVHVRNLFHVESYPTVHQMVSTVSGQLKEEATWKEIFQSIFPSGSITGAPKRRTMQIIHQLETAPRNIYTGAIGYMAPTGASAFSVAIRTLMLQQTHGEQTVSMGVGGGIVADSTAHSEWRECLLKSSFVHSASEELLLIETMLLDGAPLQVLRLPMHLARLETSAFNLGFRFNEQVIRSRIAEVCERLLSGPQKLRLTLARDGEPHVMTSLLDPWPKSLSVIIAPERTRANDPALRYKTTFRHTYDKALHDARAHGWNECLFLNTRGELTEGCITNLLLQKGRLLFTPATMCGVLPGVMRQCLLQADLVQEAVLSLADVEKADALYLCNSVRGIVPIRSLQIEPGRTLLFDIDSARDHASQWNKVLE